MMIKHSIKLTKLKKESAQTFVEFALVFPIVLLITFGIIEFGRMVFIYTAVTGATREGARYGAAAGGTFGGTLPHYARCTDIRNAVHSTAFLITIPDSKILISYDQGPGLGQVAATCEILANDPSLVQLGDRIVVHVTAHYSPIVSFLGFTGFDIISEDARTILVKVGIYGTPAP
jgi:Flp pilus assembly protein TadG